MKKIFFLVAILSSITLFSQSNKDRKVDFGATFGYNYGSNGDNITSSGFGGNIINKFSSDKRSGYHVGAYVKINLNKAYIRPEVLYTKTKSDYNSQSFDQSKIDIPLLYGFNVLKPLSIFVGPSFQYIIDNKFEDFNSNEFEVDKDLAVNFQVGVALQLGSQVRLDARYEKGLSKNIITLVNDLPVDEFTSTIDSKPEQFILSLSLQL